jgi:hypothetical protein
VVFAAIEAMIFAPLCLTGTVFQVDIKQWCGTGIILTKEIQWRLMIILLAIGKNSITSFVLTVGKDSRTLCD